MDAKVINIADARGKERSDGGTIRFTVDPNGDLSIRPIRADGIVVKAYVVADQDVDGLLWGIKRARDRRKAETAGNSVAEPPGTTPPEQTRRRRCHKKRDGGYHGHGGCRRLERHEGQCRDAKGDFTPAVCSHIGTGRTRIVTMSGTSFRCMRCSAEAGPESEGR